MVFNAIFNNISVISWRSVLLVEETGVPIENHQPAASHWQTLSHNVVSSTPRLSGIQTHNFSGFRYWLHRYILCSCNFYQLTCSLRWNLSVQDHTPLPPLLCMSSKTLWFIDFYTAIKKMYSHWTKVIIDRLKGRQFQLKVLNIINLTS